MTISPHHVDLCAIVIIVSQNGLCTRAEVRNRMKKYKDVTLQEKTAHDNVLVPGYTDSKTPMCIKSVKGFGWSLWVSGCSGSPSSLLLVPSAPRFSPAAGGHGLPRLHNRAAAGHRSVGQQRHNVRCAGDECLIAQFLVLARRHRKFIRRNGTPCR